MTTDDGARVESFPPMFPGGGRIGIEEEAAVLEVIRSKRLFRYGGLHDGPSAVEAFEEALADVLGCQHAVAVGSGTLALMTALAAAGIGPGDAVIVPAYTWISTAAAVLAVGAVPVVAEVDETLTMDTADAEQRMSDSVKAVIPVHMRGAPADMDAVSRFARRHDLQIVEDAAQAIGGRYHGRRLGTIGQLGCFSLQFNKIITSGEGGVVVTDDRRLNERALLYHDVAASQRRPLGDTPVFIGIVARMSELQGAVAGAQLKRLDDIIQDCRRNRAMVLDGIAGDLVSHDIRLRPCPDSDGDTAIALVLLCPDARTAATLSERLRASHVPARVLFQPEREDLHVVCHWTPLFAKRGWSEMTPWDQASSKIDLGPADWPRTTEILGRAVHIDISPDLTEAQVERMVSSIRSAAARLGGAATLTGPRHVA